MSYVYTIVLYTHIPTNPYDTADQASRGLPAPYIPIHVPAAQHQQCDIQRSRRGMQQHRSGLPQRCTGGLPKWPRCHCDRGDDLHHRAHALWPVCATQGTCIPLSQPIRVFLVGFAAHHLVGLLGGSVLLCMVYGVLAGHVQLPFPSRCHGRVGAWDQPGAAVWCAGHRARQVFDVRLDYAVLCIASVCFVAFAIFFAQSLFIDCNNNELCSTTPSRINRQILQTNGKRRGIKSSTCWRQASPRRARVPAATCATVPPWPPNPPPPAPSPHTSLAPHAPHEWRATGASAHAPP